MKDLTSKRQSVAKVALWLGLFVRHPSKWAWRGLARTVCGLAMF